MEDAATATPKPGEIAKRKREQSTIAWPYNDLSDGVTVAQAIWDNVGTSTCDLPQLAAWLGHDTVDSGAFRLRVTAARTFGLITGTKQIQLSDLGRAVVDPDRAPIARIEAFLRVPLYGRLFERYEGSTLPSTNVALEADLVDLGVADKQKDRARQVFQRSADQAGFFSQGRNRLVRPAIRQNETGETADERRSGGGGTGNGSGGDLEPFVQVLVRSLPKPGTVWPKAERQKWITLANAAFDVVYKDAEPKDGPIEPPLPPSQSPDDAPG